ncbi:fibronectin type III domain-containing protein [Actinoplanes sp. NPDC049118]|uniref:fibronectin type III domain-containing protein n=1 Tax=Actinoplanes sp. NPDC049118 TaxID=3155769 RepID=UPI0033C4F0A9
MRHVAPPLAELTAQAQTLTSAGDLAGARDMLADVLDPADADPQRASPDLALAAALQARILIALGDPHGARTWAGFAHAAEERLHGPHDERTVAAAATHAAVLHRVGNHGRAAQLYHDLVGELAALDGSLSPRVLAAEADLATAEHAAGHCAAARTRLADAWGRHHETYGDAAPAGIKMLARLGAMERECGRDGEAQAHLAQAQELCARHLPPDHPLAQQVARLAGAPATGRHVCGRVQSSTGPTSGGPASGVTRVPATTIPGVHPVRRPAPGDLTGRHARPEPPLTLPLTSPPAQPAAPIQEQGPAVPEHESYEHALHRPAPHEQAVPEQALHRPPADLEPEVDEQARAAPGQNGTAAALPPQAWTVEPPGPWPPDSFPPDAYPPDAYPPGPRLSRGPVDRATAPVPDRRLPVPVERPDRNPSRQSLVLAAVLVAGIAVAAAVVVATLPEGARDPAPGPTAAAPAAAPPTSASPSPSPSPTNTAVAPTSVTLKDNRDSVSLTWRYPKGSEGPVLISGGRTGQEQRAFQQLPAGTTDYVVYGLNKQNDYCFTVAVVYTVDQVAASRPVCTRRN